MPGSQYYSITLPSATSLKACCRSTRKLDNLVSNGSGFSGTNETRLGIALSVLILEPHLFADEYSTTPKEGKTLISLEELAQLKSMAEAVESHPWIKALPKDSSNELTLIGRHENVLIKSRLDCYHESLGLIIDLKTTNNATYPYWTKRIKDYAVQAAVYRQQIRARGLPFSRFVFAAVERTEPYEVGLYEIGSLEMDEAWDSLVPLLKKYHEASENGFKPNTVSPELITWVPRKPKTKSSSHEASEVIGLLNELAGKKFKNVLRPDLEARISEYGVTRVKEVVEHKVKEWKGTDMGQYLRPETLFNRTKFEAYDAVAVKSDILTKEQLDAGWVVVDRRAVEPFKPVSEYENKSQGAKDLTRWYQKYTWAAAAVGFPDRWEPPCKKHQA